jgi:hypothetical protein
VSFVAAEQEGQLTAWERRRDLGFWPALWGTWRDSVFKPIPFFRSLAARGTIGSAVSYFVLVAAVGLFFNLYWGTFESLLAGSLDDALGPDLGLTLTGGQRAALLIVGTGVAFIFMLLLYIAALFFTAAIVHVGFAIVGAGRQGFEGTLRAMAFSAGPLAFLVFPFFGQLVALVWTTVLIFIAMREVQRTTNRRATVGFLLPAIALSVLFAVAMFLFALLLTTAELAPPL